MHPAHLSAGISQLGDKPQIVQLARPGRRQRLPRMECPLPLLVAGYVVVLQRLKAPG
jgi:hypothetical protein